MTDKERQRLEQRIDVLERVNGTLRAVLDACAAERHALSATLDAVRSALDTHAAQDTDSEPTP